MRAFRSVRPPFIVLVTLVLVASFTFAVPKPANAFCNFYNNSDLVDFGGMSVLVPGTAVRSASAPAAAAAAAATRVAMSTTPGPPSTALITTDLSPGVQR